MRRMNRRAAQLGLGNTHFTNSRGQDQPGHYSCARDLAELGRYAWLKSAVFRGLVATKTTVVTWPPSHRVRVTSHNRLLDRTWGDGIKTGATAKAGKVLVGSGTPGGVPLIVVTMRESSRDRETQRRGRALPLGRGAVTRPFARRASQAPAAASSPPPPCSSPSRRSLCLVVAGCGGSADRQDARPRRDLPRCAPGRGS